LKFSFYGRPDLSKVILKGISWNILNWKDYFRPFEQIKLDENKE